MGRNPKCVPGLRPETNPKRASFPAVVASSLARPGSARRSPPPTPWTAAGDDMGEDVQDHSLFVYGDIMEKEAAFLRSHIPPERVYLNLTTEFMAMSGKYADVRLSVPDA